MHKIILGASKKTHQYFIAFPPTYKAKINIEITACLPQAKTIELHPPKQNLVIPQQNNKKSHKPLPLEPTSDFSGRAIAPGQIFECEQNPKKIERDLAVELSP